jgi:penicillin-binding protein 1A
VKRARLSSVCAAVALALVSSACAIHLPRIPNAKPTIPQLPQTSVLYDDQGRFITTLHADENRTVIPIGQIPVVMRNAVIAVEDQRFYEHRGVDVKAIVRAALQNVKQGRIAQGASTITEQLIKNTITGNERTLTRKIKDAILAHQLEQRYTKNQILDMYLNTVYFGQGAYGIQAAAKTYFSVPPSDLTLAQAALLAGLVSSPSKYDPVFHPDDSLSRRNLVLERMLGLQMIDYPDYQAAAASPVQLDLQRSGRYPAPHFVDYVKQWFLTNPAFGDTQEDRYNTLFEGGLRIYTTVDLRLQKEAEDAINGILSYRKDPYGAMTVIDPKTGAIRAMVGGRDYFGKSKIAELNLATGGATGRQAGSSFKPFALVTALEQGISPLTVYQAPPHLDLLLPPGYSPRIWPVSNYDGEGGGSMTLEQATIKSINTVYAQLILQEGAGNVVATARRMGITSSLRSYPSAVLGTNEVNTLEMASAFGTLDTLGQHVPPIAVWRITDSSGRVVYQADPQPTQAVSPGVAWTTVQILQKVVKEGTGTEANFGRPAAGKTGTAEHWTNAWFVGFVPQLVAAVWVGFPKGQVPMTYPRVRLAHVLGGTWPTEIWHAFMVKATRGMPVQTWTKPSFGFVSVPVDVRRWCLPNAWTLPSDVQVITFYDGTQPTNRCSQPSGPQRIALPSVVGVTQTRAQQVLQSFGFQVSVTQRQSAKAPPGSVLSQDPPPGSIELQGSTVTIVVATAPPAPSPSPSPSPVVVPDVVGLTQAEAVSQLTADGFNVSVVTEWCKPKGSCKDKPGIVWQQSPPGGSYAPPGSTVVLWVNPGG